MTRLVVAGTRNTAVTPNTTTYCLRTADSDLIWSADHGATVLGVCGDADGNVYTAGNQGYISGEGPVNCTTRKYDAEGGLLWRVDHGRPAYCICVDTSGNVIAGGNANTSNSFTLIRKYNSAGTQQWAKTYGSGTDSIYCYGIACDPTDGAIYAGGTTYSSISLRQFAADGTAGWTAAPLTTIYGVAAPGDGRVYVAGFRTSSKTLVVLDASDGSVLYSYDHGNASYQYNDCVAANGVKVGVGQRDDRLGFTVKVHPYATTTGNWTANTNRVNGLAVDNNNQWYAGGLGDSGYNLRAYTDSGTVVWEANPSGGYNLNAVAWIPLIPEMPGLPIGLSLGTPLSAYVSLSPGCVFGLSLGIPTATAAPTPPAQADQYRAYITGGPTYLLVPIASLQCVRRASGTNRVMVVVPGWTEALQTDVAGRYQPQLVIHAGYGNQWGEFVRGAITDIDHDRTARHWTATLTVRLEETATTATHYLTGISERGMDDSGMRFAVSEVNPQLRVGHTIHDGMTTWTVGSVEYQISPDSARMTVTEDG